MPSVKAFILRAKPYQEGDLIIEALGSHGERLTMIAKNAIKSRKRFGGGVLEPLNYSELTYSSRRSGFDFLQEGSLVYGFPQIRESYDKIRMALYFVKLILDVTRDGMDENKFLFDLLGNSLKTLEGAEDLQLLKAHFEIKFLYYLGMYVPAGELLEFAQRPVSHHGSINVADKKLQEILVHTQGEIQKLKEL